MTNDADIRIRLRVCVSMAKAMMQKLREYSSEWDKDMWDDNEDYSNSI